jgi:hypothetical protein
MKHFLGSAFAATLAALCVAVLSAHAEPAAPAEPEDEPGPAPVDLGVPSATLNVRGKSVSAGIGFAWGEATLHYGGKTYPVRMDGVVTGAIGVASVEAIAQVYGLKQVEDLNGNFTALGMAGAIGKGAGAVALRNEKGVRIVVDFESAGVQLAIGPRGVTLSVGEAGEDRADGSARIPPALGFGEAKFGSLRLRPTLNGQVFIAASGNPGFGGEFSVGPVDDAHDWVETSSEAGLNAGYTLGEEGTYGRLEARVSGVFSKTGSGPDGPVCNGSESNTSDFSLESAYLAWKSGSALPFGEDAVEISGGNQNYQVFDGLLFWDGGQDCVDRGANWLSPRKAFHRTGIITLNLDKFVVEGAHLKFNDEQPDSDTQIGLGRIEYVTDDGPMQHFKLGGMLFNIYDSDTPSRDGMKGIYLHHDATPLRSLPGFAYKASWIRESNSRSSGLTKAYGWYIAPSYEFSSAGWKPKIGYRYARFSGGGTQAFDPLFGGLQEWGLWVQGELLGEYIISNSNLTSHQVRLTVKPSDQLTVNLAYYKFLLDDREQGFSTTTTEVSSKRLADEVDLIFDYAPANWWSISATVSAAIPDSAFKEAVGGSSTWINGYLSMNFNF